MTFLTKNTFDEVTIQKVWDRAVIVSGYDAAKYRKDVAGAWIQRDKYGDVSNDLGLGWEVDHRRPVTKGGTDDLSNLRPLHWKNNRSKGDDYPEWKSAVSSEDNKNVYKTQGCKEN